MDDKVVQNVKYVIMWELIIWQTTDKYSILIKNLKIRIAANDFIVVVSEMY